MSFCFLFLQSFVVESQFDVCVFVGPGTGLVPTAWQTAMKSRPAQVHQTRKTRPNSPTTLLEPRGETFKEFAQNSNVQLAAPSF